MKVWQKSVRSRTQLASVIGLALALFSGSSHAELRHIKVGSQHVTMITPLYMAEKKGYFAAEGLDVELIDFQGTTSWTAAVAGSVDFGCVAVSAGFYNIAGQTGALKIISGYMEEAPGWPSTVLVASNKAYGEGLHSVKDLAGHVVGGGTTGGASEYMLALLAEKNGIDYKALQFRSLQSNPNVASAVVGNQVDAGVVPSGFVLPQIQNHQVQVLAWFSDSTPFQLGITFVRTEIADKDPDMVAGFLRAFRKGAREYHDAFTGPDGTEKDQPTAPEILHYASEYLHQSPEIARQSAGFVDADLRLNVDDVRHQIEWFRAHGYIQANFDPEKVLDRRFIVPKTTPH